MNAEDIAKTPVFVMNEPRVPACEPQARRKVQGIRDQPRDAQALKTEETSAEERQREVRHTAEQLEEQKGPGSGTRQDHK
jgi:hypothetical protein